MITEDIVVFAHPNGIDYVANFTEQGWLRWPAVAKGWLSRQGCPPSLAEQCEELSPRLGRIALLLSGVVS